MIRRDHAVLTALATGGAALTLFQNWYISLPLEEASRIDICRFNPVINCFKSLHAHGEELLAFGVPVFPALAGIFLFQAALCGFAWCASAPRGHAWLMIARLASLPASGLAIFVLLNDLMVAKATSASAVLVAAASIWISVLAVLNGLSQRGFRKAGAPTVALLAGAALAAFFLDGTTTARRAHDGLSREQELALPAILYPTFAHALPRIGAASLGDPLAPFEVLLFVDPAQAGSRKLMRRAARGVGKNISLTLYARGEEGARMILAHRAGTLVEYLKDPSVQPPGVPAAVRELVRRHEAALSGETAPTAWTRGRKWTQPDLNEILAAASNR